MSAKMETNQPAKILVVDDEESITELLSEMLLLMGHEPHCCNHPMEALSRMERESYDLVLSDFRMPGMNGQQFHAAVQQRCPQLAGKIVFLTGDVGNDGTRNFLNSLGNENLNKPFQFNEVTDLITRLVQKEPKPLAA